MHDEDVISTMAEEGDTKLRITMYNTYPKKVINILISYSVLLNQLSNFFSRP